MTLIFHRANSGDIIGINIFSLGNTTTITYQKKRLCKFSDGLKEIENISKKIIERKKNIAANINGL